MIILNKKSYYTPDMYKSFKITSKEAFDSKLKNIERYKDLLIKIKFYIEERRDIIQNSFGICIYNYWEWNTDIPDNNNKLFNDIDTLYKSFDNYKTLLHRTDYLEFIKYFKIIRRIELFKSQANRIQYRNNISYNEFKEYIKRYYQQVSKEILYGRVYKFSNGVGNLLIERISNECYEEGSNKFPDWQATKKAKADLIAKGLKPYDNEEAKLYADANKEYDGVKYVIYLNHPFTYRVMLCDRRFANMHYCMFKSNTTKVYETQENILKRCKNIDDIINLEYDTKCRLSLIRKFDNSYTQKFIRNDEQKPITYRKYRCEIRQRLQY